MLAGDARAEHIVYALLHFITNYRIGFTDFEIIGITIGAITDYFTLFS